MLITFKCSSLFIYYYSFLTDNAWNSSAVLLGFAIYIIDFTLWQGMTQPLSEWCTFIYNQQRVFPFTEPSVHGVLPAGVCTLLSESCRYMKLTQGRHSSSHVSHYVLVVEFKKYYSLFCVDLYMFAYDTIWLSKHLPCSEKTRILTRLGWCCYIIYDIWQYY